MELHPTPFLIAAAILLPACTTTPPPAPAEQSVNPGINTRYLDPDLDPTEWTKRFEVESREVYDARLEIVKAIGLRSGMDIADVGAGTGLFVEPFARAIGPDGTVYALEIAPAFVKHIQERAAANNLPNVRSQLCSETSIDLPPDSIDIAFVCDVYHHFEYPQSSLASIHKALRPNGQLIVIDFERIPGVSAEWLLNHVRAGKEVVTAEIEAAGFELIEQELTDRLKENYFLRFAKR